MAIEPSLRVSQHRIGPDDRRACPELVGDRATGRLGILFGLVALFGVTMLSLVPFAAYAFVDGDRQRRE